MMWSTDVNRLNEDIITYASDWHNHMLVNADVQSLHAEIDYIASGDWK